MMMMMNIYEHPEYGGELLKLLKELRELHGQDFKVSSEINKVLKQTLDFYKINDNNKGL